LIHVPINIPAYAVSTDTVADMNRELIAHGYSNIISGLFGGLQNYFAYTQSVLYYRSGGEGKLSGLAVAACTVSLYVFGPFIASYIPRCMAGTLLLHVGIDNSIGKFDYVEYAGIWLIVVVMSVLGMEAAMIAGGIAAVSTHAVQSIHYVNPIRGVMTASTLRSSQWNRTNEQRAILDDDAIGRGRILVIQMHGHLFFGNMAQFTENISHLLSDLTKDGKTPWIVILDFSLVLGIDSSAAQSMTKLTGNLRKSFGVDLCIFVSGSDSGFPCEFDLSSELTSYRRIEDLPDESTSLLQQINGTVVNDTKFCGSHVEKSLDLALAFAEDALLHRNGVPVGRIAPVDSQASDHVLALLQLANLCPNDTTSSALELLFSYFLRETYVCSDILWKQGSASDCVKLLVRGRLIALIENEAGTNEIVHSGNTVGELGLLQGLSRMSTLRCHSDEAVMYSLSRDSFEVLCRLSPESARLLDLICIRYLSARVQHVSNRVFETRCLPI
jgi:SulP family sulfate permease